MDPSPANSSLCVKIRRSSSWPTTRSTAHLVSNRMDLLPPVGKVAPCDGVAAQALVLACEPAVILIAFENVGGQLAVT